MVILRRSLSQQLFCLFYVTAGISLYKSTFVQLCCIKYNYPCVLYLCKYNCTAVLSTGSFFRQQPWFTHGLRLQGKSGILAIIMSTLTFGNGPPGLPFNLASLQKLQKGPTPPPVPSAQIGSHKFWWTGCDQCADSTQDLWSSFGTKHKRKRVKLGPEHGWPSPQRSVCYFPQFDGQEHPPHPWC